MRVTIVEDHPLVRSYLKSYVHENFPDAQITLLHVINQNILQDIVATQPELIILDISLNDMDSIDFFPELKASLSDAKVIIYTMHYNNSYIEFYKNNGAHAYVLKENASDDLKGIINLVRNNQFFFPGDTVEMDMNYRLNQLTFSKTEKQIMHALHDGLDNESISSLLNIPRQEVLRIRKKLLFKTGAANTLELLQLSKEYPWLN
jgi:DNA-binding NarL/FixJ family response regulator